MFAAAKNAPHAARGYCRDRCLVGVLGALVVPGAGDAGLFARQASEQYLTSAQFLAQLFRHVISRPQVTQILLGSADLLPLKPEWGGIDVA